MICVLTGEPSPESALYSKSQTVHRITGFCNTKRSDRGSTQILFDTQSRAISESLL